MFSSFSSIISDTENFYLCLSFVNDIRKLFGRNIIRNMKCGAFEGRKKLNIIC